MADWPIGDVEPDRFQISEANGQTFLVDTSCGRTWILRHADSKPVWVGISMASEKKGDA